MTFIFLKISWIIYLATAFYPIHYGVNAHCFNPDGSFAHGSSNHLVVGCYPTVSPAPTESPAPSPSPSYVPTNTQQPSHSMAPSHSPSSAPSTPKPSSTPTDLPTESPAPSPSPSAIPTPLPSKSVAPSTSPTVSPSESPSQNPSSSPTTSSPSVSPTGPILLTVENVKFAIENITRKQEMDPLHLKYFEKEMTFYLREQIQEAPGAFKFHVENVLVTDQILVVQNEDSNFSRGPVLRRRRRLEEMQTNLVITIDVVVSVLFNTSENLKLMALFEEFFNSNKHQTQLRDLLEHDEFFGQGIVTKEEFSSSDAFVKKEVNGTAITGTILGLLALVVGSGILWMWIQARRGVSSEPKVTAKIQNFNTISRSFESDNSTKREIDENYSQRSKSTRNSQECHVETDSLSNSQLMYIPTLMPTLSNIEVPDTPVTAFAVNGFTTPASANGFMTPASTRSNKPTAALPKLLGESIQTQNGPSEKELKDASSSNSRKQKLPLPPKLLSPFKSPFLREMKAGDTVEKDDGQDFDAFSISGVGLVAGENNVGRYKEKEKKATTIEAYFHAPKPSRDLPPSEIGGPRSTHFDANTTVVPVEEKVVSRTFATQRDKKKNSGSRHHHPVMIGGPYGASLNLPKAKKTEDPGFIDVVDEIAYLYSTHDEPNKYRSI